MRPKLNKDVNVTFNHLYLSYRYKYYDVNSKTVPRPYFSKSELSNHEYKLTCKEWTKIAVCIFSTILEMLMEGKEIIFPEIGSFRMFKRKRLGFDFNRNKSLKEIQVYKNAHTDGFKPYIKWDKSRSKASTLRFKTILQFNFLETVWKDVSKQIIQKPYLIYNFPNL